MNFETFEHEADIGVRGFGETLDQAFENGAKALFSIMIELDNVEPKDRVEISCDAPDNETLFVEWLNQLISEADLKNMAFSKFEVKIESHKLVGYAYGELLDQEKHKTQTEVKAATYSQLKVYQENGKYIAQCIVDV